ncbi:MAG: hypothetical protein K6U11_02640 [bacterium]|nr:hypothetical protein [bacterium]
MAKKLCRSIQRLAAKEKESYTEKMKELYRELIDHALRLASRCEETINEAKKQLKTKGLKADSVRIRSLISELEQCLALTREACQAELIAALFDLEPCPHSRSMSSC